MKKFAIGDIHGAYKALIQCLQRSNFDYQKDTLVVLGDIVDGWPETPQCIEELLKIKNLIMVKGNHDQWVQDWFKSGVNPDVWTSQGGKATIKAYDLEPELFLKHRFFFDHAPYYYLDEKQRLFIHGGIHLHLPLKEQSPEILMWDRTLAYRILFENETIEVKEFKEIYLGHTSTWTVSKVPVIKGNIILLDQGAGWSGKLSIINIDTKEFWQSDVVTTLYPDVQGRK